MQISCENSDGRLLAIGRDALLDTELSCRCLFAAKTLRFCYDRLTSLTKTLEITDTDEFTPLNMVANFATLVGTYETGFAIIVEPYDNRMPSVPDPIIQVQIKLPGFSFDILYLYKFPCP